MALVLSRKLRQRIFIGDDIVITLLRVNGESCRLGIEAPRGVQIEREEVVIARESKVPKVSTSP